MEKKFITEADMVHDEWYESARTQTLATLPVFLSHLLDDYSHDGKTIIHAITAGSMATISAMNSHPEGDMSPSQNSQLLGMFIRKWSRIEGPAKIMSWAGLLNSDNKSQIMGVPQEIVKWLSTLALRAIEEKKFKNESQKEHLQKISQGEMPWGYSALGD
jgi:hypothetical protein